MLQKPSRFRKMEPRRSRRREEPEPVELGEHRLHTRASGGPERTFESLSVCHRPILYHSASPALNGCSEITIRAKSEGLSASIVNGKGFDASSHGSESAAAVKVSVSFSAVKTV